MRALVVVNPKAGSLGGSEFSSVVGQLKILLEPRGIRPLFIPITSLASSRLSADQADIVIVAGGDGTVHAVTNHIVDETLPLGILPVGTRNHFAQDIGMALDLEGAVDQIASGNERLVDTAELNGTVFVNNSSVGIYPRLLDKKKDQSLIHRPRLLATLLAVVGTLRYRQTISVRLTVDTQVVYRQTPMVFISNNRYEVAPPHLGRRQRLDGGELSVLSATCPLLKSLFYFIRFALTDRPTANPCIEYRSTASAALDLPRRHVRVTLDGELRRFQPPLRYRIRPKSLRLIS